MSPAPRRATPRSRKIDLAVLFALLVGCFFSSATTTWIDGLVTCPRPRHTHGAGEFITAPGWADLTTALALAVVGALLGALAFLGPFRVGARRSPGQVVTGGERAQPIARVWPVAAAAFVLAALAGIGVAVARADASDFKLSYFVAGWLRSRLSPCVPDRLPATVGFHVAAVATGLVAGWVTRLARYRLVVAAVALLGVAAGVSGASGWLRATLSNPRAACTYYVAEEWPQGGGRIRNAVVWNRTGSIVFEALWLAGSDPAMGGTRLEWREPFMFRSGAELGFRADGISGVDSCRQSASAPLQRVSAIEAVSLIREEGTRVPCLEAAAFLRGR
jgi:hypothetical protein